MNASVLGRPITLITGDVVTLLKLGGGRASPKIAHGPGRDHITFSIRERRGEITVIPEDVMGLVASGKLDRALFNVTRLIEDGYADDRRKDTPLLIEGVSDAPGLRKQVASAGLTVDRVLPGLHVMAVRQQKGSGGASLAALRAKSGFASAAPGAKIWLDHRRKISLDHSVPQIGAPAAYARGLTGAGVVVAVLDTGIDAGHPDLIGKVVAAEAFVDDGAGTSDVFGHGTHVASIVAGSGAASGGQLHGVAPGASLLSGRVCDADGGCYDSAILAGMEWAVSHGAKIVNLSLGGYDEPELDPIEAAVNQLSAEHGTLFVAAAGNSGGIRQISTPASADAALCVGAVDGGDALAPFSSRGPRVGDRAIKPDLVAPGVGIVAARASGTELGEPVGESYVRLSGTSMATPHVAGAAALLLQQHPDWTGLQVKQALMSTSQSLGGLTAYEQGAGRVDVDRATAQAVTSEPSTLELGVAISPHEDDPLLVRTVRYRNAGALPVTLSLAAALAGRSGPAPAGMIAVTPAVVTVPAGGVTEVQVVVDTRDETADVVYTGALIATGGATRLITLVAVERELPSFNLTVNAISTEGLPAYCYVSIYGVGEPGDPVRETVVNFFEVLHGQATFRMPRGTYVAEAIEFFTDSWMLAPRVSMDGDKTLLLDARLGKRTELSLPEPGLMFRRGTIDFEDSQSEYYSGLYTHVPFATAEVGASAAPGAVRSTSMAYYLPAEVPARSVYQLGRVEQDHFPTGWKQTLRSEDFATVEADHAGPADHLYTKYSAAIPPIGAASPVAGPPVTGPFHLTEHYYGVGYSWYGELDEAVANPDAPSQPTWIHAVDSIETYRADHSVRQSWNQAPYGVSFAAHTFAFFPVDGSGSPRRYQNLFVLGPAWFSDQRIPARDGVSLLEEGHSKLFRNGVLFAETTSPFSNYLVEEIPEGRAEYRFETGAKRSPELFELSTSVSAAWTFHAQAPSEGAPELEYFPLPTVRFAPALDLHNHTSVRVMALPITIERPLHAAKPSIASARVDVSFDDGATWKHVPVFRLFDQAIALIVHPRGARYVSLRGMASDVEGNSGEQTIVRAYGVD